MDQFLPTVLGNGAIPDYDPSNTYDDNIRGNVFNEFPTAAMRFGHSMLVDTIDLVD